MKATNQSLHSVPATHPTPHYFGKYRGTVLNNLDPLQMGRIQAQVPDVQSILVLNWAMPCTPYPAPNTVPLSVPPVGAQVWIEFEAGDVDHPIWSGCFWTEGHPPLLQTPA